MTCKEIKETTKEMARENAGVLLLSDALSAVVALIPLIGWVAVPPVLLGTYENFYNVLKGKETSWKKLYGKFDRQFESTFLFELYLEVAAVALAIIGALVSSLIIAQLQPFLLLLLTLVLIVGGFILGCILIGFEDIGMELLLLNPEMKGNEVFDKAWEIIKQNWRLFVSLGASFIGQLLLVIITFGLYAIKLVPHYGMANAMLADEIISGRISADSIKKESEENEPVVFCSECGAKNSVKANYCDKCGAKLIK